MSDIHLLVQSLDNITGKIFGYKKCRIELGQTAKKVIKQFNQQDYA